MNDIDQLRADAARDRHLAKVERLLSREGVSPTIVDRLAAVVDAPVGADDAEIQRAVASLRTEVPGVFADTSSIPGRQSSSANAAKERAAQWARDRFGTTNTEQAAANRAAHSAALRDAAEKRAGR